MGGFEDVLESMLRHHYLGVVDEEGLAMGYIVQLLVEFVINGKQLLLFDTVVKRCGTF